VAWAMLAEGGLGWLAAPSRAPTCAAVDEHGAAFYRRGYVGVGLEHCGFRDAWRKLQRGKARGREAHPWHWTATWSPRSQLQQRILWLMRPLNLRRLAAWPMRRR
jgi:hypothetical protein